MRNKRCFAADSLFLLLACSTAAYAQSSSRPQIFAPYVDTVLQPISINGELSDWTQAALQHGIHFYKNDGHTGTASSLGTTVLGTISSRQDCEVTVHLAHDGTWLYLAAIIVDDRLEQRPQDKNMNEAWKEDCLHIYIDSTNAARADIPNPPIANQVGYEQFGVSTDYNCYTENCDFTTHNGSGGALSGARPDDTNWKVSVGITGSGPYFYIFEERIPFHEVTGRNLRTMNPGQSYGFNAEFCDSDAGAYLQGWIFWSSNGAVDAWNYQNLWGTMQLEEEPANCVRCTDWVAFE